MSRGIDDYRRLGQNNLHEGIIWNVFVGTNESLKKKYRGKKPPFSFGTGLRNRYLGNIFELNGHHKTTCELDGWVACYFRDVVRREQSYHDITEYP